MSRNLSSIKTKPVQLEKIFGMIGWEKWTIFFFKLLIWLYVGPTLIFNLMRSFLNTCHRVMVIVSWV